MPLVYFMHSEINVVSKLNLKKRIWQCSFGKEKYVRVNENICHIFFPQILQSSSSNCNDPYA